MLKTGKLRSFLRAPIILIRPRRFMNIWHFERWRWRRGVRHLPPLESLADEEAQCNERNESNRDTDTNTSLCS
jgi:hypothetical protein